MTSRERFLASLRREQPDRVPIWELIVDEPIIKALHGDITYLDFVEKEGLDAILVFENNRTEEIGPHTYRDEWGIVWRVAGHGVSYPIDGPLRSEADLDAFRPPDPDADYLLDNLKQAQQRFEGEKALVFLGHETFEFSHYLVGGMEELFIHYITNPEFVDRLLEMIWSYKSRLMERAAEEGADALLTGDDYAYQKSTIMSPEHFKRFVLPWLKKAVDIAHGSNIPFIKHSDGNLWEVLDEIVDTGIDGLDPIEPIAHMDIGEVKEKFGDRVALVGNVDCTEVLPHGTREQVIDAVKETIAKAAPGGGHILASSNSIHPAVKPENYRTMLEAAREFGAYPLDEKMVQEYRQRNYVAEVRDA